MTTTLAPSRPTTRGSRTASRFGYGVAAVVNGVLLWIAHRLLDWEWPNFLTAGFGDLLPLLTASFVASIVVNAAFVLHDRGRFRAAADLVTAAFGLAVSLRTWDLFPFDFSDYATDWSWVARTAIVVGIVGTAIAVLVNLVKLFRPPDRA